METLLPMVEFILRQNKRLIEDTFFDVFKYVTLSIKYSEFLKLKLELWMFVPCDGKGNPITKPVGYDEWVKHGKYTGKELKSILQYQLAVDKIIFEGVYLDGDKLEGDFLLELDKLNNLDVNYMAENLHEVKLSEKYQLYLETNDLETHV